MPHVTVPDEPTRVTFVVTTADDGPFAFAFSYFDPDDVEVYDGDDLVDPADYTLTPTVSATGGYEGGTITLDVAVSNTQITVLRNVPIVRTTDFPTSGRFPIDTLNSWLDKFIAILQQLSTRIDRTLIAPTTDPTSIDMELPAATTRATKVLAFDADGNPVASTLTLSALEAQPAGAAASAAAAAASAVTAAASATAAQTAETNAETAETAAEAAQAAAEAAAASIPSFPIDPADTTFAATKRVLGRDTAGAGTGEEVTLSQLLDWIGSAAQGDILYRDSSGWARLAAGTSGHFLKTQGAAANPTWAALPSSVPDLIYLRNEQTSGTNGGGISVGTTTAVLNTEVVDTGSLCSLSANQFTLTAGTYEVFASVPLREPTQARLRIRNVTDSTTLALGQGVDIPVTGGANTTLPALLLGRFTVAASKALELQIYAAASYAASGQGKAVASGETEVFAQVWLKKVG